MTEATVLGIVSILLTAIVSMQWFLLREVRAAVNGLARNISDLTLTLALEVATRPTAGAGARDIARRIVRDRDEVRLRELDDHSSAHDS